MFECKGLRCAESPLQVIGHIFLVFRHSSAVLISTPSSKEHWLGFSLVPLFLFFREALEKMIDVYRQNSSLGDPATIEQNLSDNAKELDALNVDLHRYQVRDYCFAMLSTRHEFCSRHFEPDPPPQISV